MGEVINIGRKLERMMDRLLAAMSPQQRASVLDWYRRREDLNQRAAYRQAKGE